MFAGLHPALQKLIRFQATARLAMFVRRVRTPRRLILTATACVLAVVWIGQAVAGVLLRPAADPARLQLWIPLGLLSYGLWHVIKTTCRKPIEPFEWTPTEQEILGAAPLARQQLVGYRLFSVVMSALVKALLFALVMLPDLAIWPLGFLGMLLGLVFLDLVRMTVEVVAWGVAPRILVRLRLAVIVLAVAAVLSALIIALCNPALTTHLPAAFALATRFFHALVGLTDTLPGQLALLPFQAFAGVILSQGSAGWLVLHTMLAITIVTGIGWALIRLDRLFLARRQARETAVFTTLTQNRTDTNTNIAGTKHTKVRIPRTLAGLGTIGWRQALGILHYGPTVLLSMALPGFLSLLPLLSEASPGNTLLQVVGSLVFYSFLLMPAALRFDFRRDVDRISVLKALPFSPKAVTAGQLAAPVIACSLFQLVVLSVVMLYRPMHPAALIVCTALLVPINAVIFGLENLIFMLFPYRPNQEGVAVFIRSILTFTAKGALFLAALLATVTWVGASRVLAEQTSFANLHFRLACIFSSGMWLATCGVAMAIFCLLAKTYDRFDPSQDTPAMS